MQPWYEIQDIATIDSPCLVVYPERVKQNIATAIRMVGDVKRLRPHIKTHKTKEGIALMQAAGIHQFKCATIAEAELLGMCKATDVLLAYQPQGPKLQRLMNLIKAYPLTRYSCLVDHIPAAEEMSVAAKAHSIVLHIYIDLNVGMNRTGIAPGKQAMALAEFCQQKKSLALIGLHAYDGHLRNPNYTQRTKDCNQAFAPVQEMQHQLQTITNQPIQLILGGSPTFPIHCLRSNSQLPTPNSLLTFSPGTFIYWDAGYQKLFPEQEFQPAALVIARVLSLPAADKICIDLGHKSVAAENPIDQRVFFLNAPELKAVSQSEEHLVVEAPVGHGYQPGMVLYGLPIHICPTCALYERALTIEQGRVTGAWRALARDRTILH